MAYAFRHAAGLLLVHRQNGRWFFTFNGETEGSWHSALAACDDVHGGHTGLYTWDRRDDTYDAPDHPSEWEWVHLPHES